MHATAVAPIQVPADLGLVLGNVFAFERHPFTSEQTWPRIEINWDYRSISSASNMEERYGVTVYEPERPKKRAIGGKLIPGHLELRQLGLLLIKIFVRVGTPTSSTHSYTPTSMPMTVVRVEPIVLSGPSFERIFCGIQLRS